MKKFFAVIFSALTLCAAAACSSGANKSAGSNASSGEESVVEADAKKLPSKVDLRNYEGKNYVTPVKTQRYGDCWSFSLAGAAEISYLFANDLGVPAGEVNNQVDFSEKYIAWYMFHGVTGNDAVKGKVRASQIGEGFDPGEAERERDLAVYFIGGPLIHDANLFGAGFVPVDESVSVKGETPYAYNGESNVGWELPLTAEYRNAPTNAFLRNSCVLPAPAGFDANGSYQLNADGLNAIKSELYKGHGVSVAFNSTGAWFNMKTRSAYYNGNEHPDHAVTVVGYDDDYPRENFGKTNAAGEIQADSLPPDNGALIIKNSWGLTTYDESDIDDGYFYLSYYDHSLTSPLSYVFDDLASAKHTAPNYDQYDLLMTNWYGSTDYDAETKMANVFDAEEDESLYQIAYATGLADTEVAYEIYKDVEKDNPSSGTLLESGVSRHSFAGFYKIDLKSEHALKKGEPYAVVLTVKHTTAAGGAAYTEFFPYSTPFFEGMTVRGIINQGESYLYTDGKWSDMSALKDSLTDRAYAQCAEELRANKALPELTLKGKEMMAIDNYPIKAILAPAN